MYLSIGKEAICWFSAALMGLSVLMPVARADLTFEVATETELREAILAVNDGGAGTHTIALTANIERTGAGWSSVKNLFADEVIIEGSGYALNSGENDSVLAFRDVVATLRNITITGGSASSGGGVRCDGATLTIENTRIAENDADYGGGIWSRGCNLNLVHTTVENNTAVSGGGIWFGPGKQTGTVLSATDTAIRGNAVTGSGGGAYAYPCLEPGQALTMVFTDSVIEENSASAGGGLYCGAGATETRLENSEVRFNQTNERGGGGIWADSDCVLELTGTTVSDNSSVGKGSVGGGIYGNGAEVEVKASTVSYNHTDYLGGGFRLCSFLDRAPRESRCPNRQLGPLSWSRNNERRVPESSPEHKVQLGG